MTDQGVGQPLRVSGPPPRRDRAVTQRRLFGV